MADEAASNSRVTELAVTFAEEMNRRNPPVGGFTGQILGKTSDVDFGMGWIDAGNGDVMGPGSSTDFGIVLFDGITGKIIKGGVTLGTADQVLTSNGAGAAPSFKTLAGAGTVTSVGGTGTVNGITLTGTVTSSGNLTLGGTLTGVSLTTQVTGTLPVANGGTGITSFGTGVATALGINVGSAGAFVTFNGAGGTPSSLTLTNATGLPVAGGGTGAASFTDAGVLIGNGTGAIQVTTAGTAGQVLTSNGAGVDPTFQTPSAGGWTQIGSTQTISTPVATLAFTSIPTTYSELFLEIVGVRSNAGTNDVLSVATSTNNGSGYATETAFTPSVAAAAVVSGGVYFPRYRGDASIANGGVAQGASTPVQATASAVTIGLKHTGGINALRILWGSGSLDAGTVKLWGK